MITAETTQNAITLVAYVTLASYILVLVGKGIRHRSAVAGLVSGWLRCACLPLGRTARTSAKADTDVERIDREARRVMSRQHLAFARYPFRIFMHFAAACLVFFCYTRQTIEEGEIHEISSDPLWLCLVCVIGGLVLEMRPQWWGMKFIDVFHFVIMTLITWKAVGTEDIFVLTFRTRGIMPIRICVAIWSGNTWLSVVMNSIFSTACSWKYASLSGETEADESFGQGSAIYFLFDEFIMTLVISVFVYALKGRSLAQATAIVNARLAKQVQATVDSLLTAQCDAVVRLSPDFEVLTGLRGLLALLLKQSSTCASFLDNLELADKPRFLDYAAACTRNNATYGSSYGPAPSLHVCLLDAYGTLVNVQLFMASFPDLDHRFEYLLGIRELSREEGDQSSSAAQSVDIYDPAHYAARAVASSQLLTRTTSHGTRSTTSSRQSNWEPSTSALAVAEPDVAAVSFVMDVFSSVITEATPGFIALGGPSTLGDNFQTWLNGNHATAFQEFVQEAVNVAMHNVAGASEVVIIIPEHAPTEITGLVLQPPIAQRAQLEYRAKCCVELLWTPGDDAEEDPMHIRASLSNVEQRRCKKVKVHRRASPPAGPRSSPQMAPPGLIAAL